jgi:hypothetical protein
MASMCSALPRLELAISENQAALHQTANKFLQVIVEVFLTLHPLKVEQVTQIRLVYLFRSLRREMVLVKLVW